MAQELITLDPSEVAEATRIELELHPAAGTGPIFVGPEGPDWGEAAIKAYMAKSERGEIPVDYDFPNREIKIPLLIQAYGETSFAEARTALQAKVGRFQEEGGWLKRTLKNGEVLYLDIVGASLALSSSSLSAQEQIDDKAELTLEAIPDFYGAETELTAGQQTATGYIKTLLTTAKGDYPSRCRIEIEEKASQNQRGLIACFRSRYYDPAATAAAHYEAEALTPISPAAVVTLSGASGGGSNNAVRHNNLATAWTPVINTNLVAGTYLTHVGTYRLWARVYTTSAIPPRLRAVYDVGDIILPEENDAVQVPGANGLYLVDLGTVRLDRDPIGTHRWQGQIQAKGAAGGENIYIDELYFFNTDEAYAVLSAPVISTLGTLPVVAYDNFIQAAGVLSAAAAPRGGNWDESGDVDDFTLSGSPDFNVARTVTNDASLSAGQHVHLDGSSSIAGCEVQADITLVGDSFLINAGEGLRACVMARFVDTNNWLAAAIGFEYPDGLFKARLLKRVAGAVSELGSYDDFSDGAWRAGTNTFARRVTLTVTSDGGAALWVAPVGSDVAEDLITVNADANLATGGALDDGKVGLYDACKLTAGVITRTYDNFLARSGEAIDSVMFAGKKAQLRTDGNWRESSDGGSYGPISFPLGRLLRIPSPGAEGRDVELLLRHSRGELNTLPDGGLDSAGVRVYARPSWLFAPGT
jgi:hypothetical protein